MGREKGLGTDSRAKMIHFWAVMVWTVKIGNNDRKVD